MAKRGQGEGSISKRPDGTWWARITVGKDENGKQKRRAFYGKTRKEVQEKLTAAVNDINNDTYIDPSKMTVGQWMDTWMKQYKRNSIKASTYAIYSSSIRNQIEPSIGNYPLKEVRNDMLQKFINGLIEKDLSPSTIRDIFKPLKGAFGQAFDNGLISKNPTYKITLPPLKRAETKVLTVDEQQCFIERSKGYRNGNLYILMLLTGLRIGEALALTWDDIDFDNNLLSVNKTQTLYTFLPDGTLKTGQSASTPKTRSSIRKIPLIPSAVEALKVQKSEITNVLESYGNSNPQNLIFCTRSGKMLDTTFVRQQIKIITGKAGISGIHPHSLRHTFATRGLEQGIELKVMQELLGHSTIDMTANLYTHVLPDKKMDSMMKLQNTVNL